MSNKKNTSFKVLHIITRMIIGGAQENTLLSVDGLNANGQFKTVLLTGPALGPEGDLLAKRKSSDSIIFLNELRRNINPIYDLIAFVKIFWFIKKFKFDIVHTHSSKAGILGRAAARLAGTKIIIHTIHGLAFFEEQSKLLNRFYIRLEQMAAKITDKIKVQLLWHIPKNRLARS